MHFKTNHHNLLKKQPYQDQAVQPRQKQPFQDHPTQSVSISQDHVTTANVCDIVAIKKAFPMSVDQVGNMPGTYTIRQTLPFHQSSMQGTKYQLNTNR